MNQKLEVGNCVRTTCMPYPRRQRSSWTRIKSSIIVQIFTHEVSKILDEFCRNSWKNTIFHAVVISPVYQLWLPPLAAITKVAKVVLLGLVFNVQSYQVV